MADPKASGSTPSERADPAEIGNGDEEAHEATPSPEDQAKALPDDERLRSETAHRPDDRDGASGSGQ